MLKKTVTLLLTVAIGLLSNISVITQTLNRQGAESIKRSNVEESSPKSNLREFLVRETHQIKTDKLFTEADAKRLEKESLNRQVKRNNLSTTAKVGIGLGVGAAVILIVVLATRGDNETPLGPVQCGIRSPCP